MSTHIGFRCPSELSNKIDEISKLSGKSKTAVMLDMMNGMLSYDVNDRHLLPEIKAIYIVWADQRILYIGQTTNLKQRFKTHHRLVEFLNYNARLSWFLAEGVDRLEIEKELTSVLAPELDRLRENKERPCKNSKLVNVNLSCTVQTRWLLEKIALEHGCLWGTNPNISKLLEYIANGEILLEAPTKDRLDQIRIAKLEAEIAKLKSD